MEEDGGDIDGDGEVKAWLELRLADSSSKALLYCIAESNWSWCHIMMFTYLRLEPNLVLATYRVWFHGIFRSGLTKCNILTPTHDG